MITYGKMLQCSRCGRKDFIGDDNDAKTTFTNIEMRDIRGGCSLGAIINEMELCSTCFGDFCDFMRNKEVITR